MAKELPYFKFDCAEWISGDITLEDFQVQGVFINICAYYWFKSGCLKTSEIKPRLKCKQSVLDKLFDSGHLKSDGDFVKISFLDEQFAERGHVSVKNSENGSKGGAPKGNRNAQKNKPAVDFEQPKTTNIEGEEKRIRTEQKRGEATPDLDQFDLWTKQIISGQDFIFHQKFKNSFPNWGGAPEKFVELMDSHLQLLNRYPAMNPNTQERFRNSALKHIKEELEKQKSNGTNKRNGLDAEQAIRAIYKIQ